MSLRFSIRTILTAFFVLTLLGAAQHAAGQAITATLEGKVTDSSGGAVVGATVTATNASTRVARSAQSNELGDYRIPLLPAGEYEVAVERDGFQQPG
jgi:hypothetical protein